MMSDNLGKKLYDVALKTKNQRTIFSLFTENKHKIDRFLCKNPNASIDILMGILDRNREIADSYIYEHTLIALIKKNLDFSQLLQIIDQFYDLLISEKISLRDANNILSIFVDSPSYVEFSTAHFSKAKIKLIIIICLLKETIKDIQFTRRINTSFTNQGPLLSIWRQKYKPILQKLTDDLKKNNNFEDTEF